MVKQDKANGNNRPLTNQAVNNEEFLVHFAGRLHVQF